MMQSISAVTQRCHVTAIIAVLPMEILAWNHSKGHQLLVETFSLPQLIGYQALSGLAVCTALAWTPFIEETQG